MDGLMTMSASPLQPAVWGHLSDVVQNRYPTIREEPKEELVSSICLDGAILNDIPARYTIRTVPEHSLPVIGVYIDPRIVPGFKYTVTVLPCQGAYIKNSYPLFDGEPLLLQSIGRGYSRRLEFARSSAHPEEDTTFWSDSHPGGVCFDLHVVVPGDRFNVLSSEGVLLGHCEIVRVVSPQEELEQTCRGNFLEKKVRVVFESETRWLDYRRGVTKEIVRGTAYCRKSADGKDGITQVLLENGSVLVPGEAGFQSLCVSDSTTPTKYEIHRLLDTELPVIGTYVDARILPGIKYQVRRLPSREMLFDGKALTLSAIGRGYGKRISFVPENLNEDAEFWSDSSPGGFAFQPVSIDVGKFFLSTDGSLRLEVIREASRSRLLRTETTDNGVEAEITFDVVCRVKRLVRITGTAVYRTSPNSRNVRLMHLNLSPALIAGQDKRRIHMLIPG